MTNAPSATYFDTHAHLDLPPLRQALAVELARAHREGVRAWVVPGVHRADWPGLLDCVRSRPDLYGAPGLHPQAAGDWSVEAAGELAELLTLPRVVALGEVGLDPHPGYPPLALQEQALRGQIRLAREAGRPLLIHCRRAFGPLLEILREERAAQVGGILHAFSGSLEVARAAIRLNFAIGIGGVLTRPNARRLPQVAVAVPAEWLVLETDAPDLPPYPVADPINRPAYLTHAAAALAALRGWDLQETGRRTTVNALRVLNIPPAAVFSEEFL